MELLNVISIDEARGIIDKEFKNEMNSETLSLFDSTGRILNKDIISNINVPHFRKSTVDGYALNSRDIFGASESIPAILDCIGEISMGKAPGCSLTFPGECMYVPTGGMLPDGADSVVMLEYTEKLDDNTILVSTPVAPLENVIETGEDIGDGEIVLKKGTILRPYEVGVLASIGHKKVDVYKKPRVGIISTGDEIVDAEVLPLLGQVRDINSYLLYSSVLQDGGVPVIYGVIKDEFDRLKAAAEKAIEECDILLISGGSSAGKKDHTFNVINSIGSPGVLIHGLSVKPGKPTLIGKAKDKIIFGLPGHPLAASVIYRLLVRHYMDKITSYKRVEYPLTCRFPLNYHKAKGREEFLPVNLEMRDGELIALPVFCKSGIITGFSRAWGYIRIEKNLEGIKEGEKIQVYQF